jgi:hypothetical protein
MAANTMLSPPSGCFWNLNTRGQHWLPQGSLENVFFIQISAEKSTKSGVLPPFAPPS